MDLSKSFDCLLQDILLDKLSPMICPLILYPFLSPTYQIGNNQIKINSILSSWSDNQKGVPKGQSWGVYFLMSLLMIFFIL